MLHATHEGVTSQELKCRWRPVFITKTGVHAQDVLLVWGCLLSLCSTMTAQAWQLHARTAALPKHLRKRSIITGWKDSLWTPCLHRGLCC